MKKKLWNHLEKLLFLSFSIFVGLIFVFSILNKPLYSLPKKDICITLNDCGYLPPSGPCAGGCTCQWQGIHYDCYSDLGE